MVWRGVHAVADSAQLFRHNQYSEIRYAPTAVFLSLKTFCSIFGYSITTTKIFSAIGYIATLFLGCTIIKKHYGSKTSIIYMLTVGAVPMMLYFSVQQRSYSWSIFLLHYALLSPCFYSKQKVSSLHFICYSGTWGCIQSHLCTSCSCNYLCFCKYISAH